MSIHEKIKDFMSGKLNYQQFNEQLIDEDIYYCRVYNNNPIKLLFEYYLADKNYSDSKDLAKAIELFYRLDFDSPQFVIGEDDDGYAEQHSIGMLVIERNDTILFKSMKRKLRKDPFLVKHRSKLVDIASENDNDYILQEVKSWY